MGGSVTDPSSDAAPSPDSRGDPAGAGRPDPEVPGPPRPFVERLGMAAIALVLAGVFAAMAVAAWANGEGFLALMAGMGAVMTVWAGVLTLRRG